MLNDNKPECSRFNNCNSYSLIGCNGCGFRHFEKIMNASPGNKDIEFLADRFFILCSEQRRGPGGRVALDKPIKELILTRIPALQEIPSRELKVKLNCGTNQIDFKIKCEGGFYANQKYFLYEVKGYGDNTNDILSAITAAQLMREVPKFKDAFYYYIGISSGTRNNKHGLTRDAFFDSKRYKVSPYTIWAEKKELLKFYGILSIESLLQEIKTKVSS